MKTLISFSIILCSILGFGQEKFEQNTLFGTKKPSIRGYVSLNAKTIELNNQIGLLTGAEATLVLNHKFNIGFYGQALLNNVMSSYTDANNNLYHYEMAQAGIKLTPTLFSKRTIHLTFPVELGLGGLSINRYRFFDINTFESNSWNDVYDYDWFAYVEPGIRAEINLFKHLRLSGGLGYTLTDPVILTSTTSKPIDGLNANLSLKVGWF